MTTRLRLTGKLHVDLPAPEAMRLFTPRGEQEWLDDWHPRFADEGADDLKKEVAAAVLDTVQPFQNKVREYLDDPAELDALLARGAEKARVVAEPKLARVYDRVGFLPAG